MAEEITRRILENVSSEPSPKALQQENQRRGLKLLRDALTVDYCGRLSGVVAQTIQGEVLLAFGLGDSWAYTGLCARAARKFANDLLELADAAEQQQAEQDA